MIAGGTGGKALGPTDHVTYRQIIGKLITPWLDLGLILLMPSVYYLTAFVFFIILQYLPFHLLLCLLLRLADLVENPCPVRKVVYITGVINTVSQGIW